MIANSRREAALAFASFHALRSATDIVQLNRRRLSQAAFMISERLNMAACFCKRYRLLISDIVYAVNKRYRFFCRRPALTLNPISDSPSRMGRPPMNVKPILVRLPEGVPDRIDAIAGKNRRAEFIREAVERELAKRESEGGENP